MALIDDIKASLRIASATTVFNAEIADLILSAKAELGISGVLDEHILDTDALIKRAVTYYCKANFGWDNPDAERLNKSWDALRRHITLSKEYTYHAITFDVTESGTAVQDAEITLTGSKDIRDNPPEQTKYTDSNGQVVFYVRPGTNYEYEVKADEGTDDGTFDVTASMTKAVTL